MDIESPEDEAREWGWQLCADARAVKRETHLHTCNPSCFQYNASGQNVQLCRHLFYHLLRLLQKDPTTNRLYTITKVRRGKQLVPEIHIQRDSSRGRRGRVMVIQIHPHEGPSNPYIQAVYRGNLDFQCMDRVPCEMDAKERTLIQMILARLRDVMSSETSRRRNWPSIDQLTGSIAKEMEEMK